MKGSGMPVTGIRPVVMPTFSNTWNSSMAITPRITIWPKRSAVYASHISLPTAKQSDVFMSDVSPYAELIISLPLCL